MHYITYKKHQIACKRIQPAITSSQQTMVFLHHGLGSISQWKNFPQLLADTLNINILLYDRLGHGNSDPNPEKYNAEYLHHEAEEVLPVVLHQNRIENPILLGHSDGASIALIYGATHPHQCKAIISIAAHVINENKSQLGIRQLIQKTDDAWFDKLKKHHSKKAEHLLSNWSSIWLDESFKNWQITDMLHRIKAPILALQGMNDEYGTSRQIQIVKEELNELANCQLIPKAKHSPHIEKPEDSIQRIKKFLKHLK